MRAKNRGIPVFVTVAVKRGSPEREKSHEELESTPGVPATRLAAATWAASVCARAHTSVPTWPLVYPEVTYCLAPASAAASAALWASLRVAYRTATSIAKAAMASIMNMAIAASTRVEPRWLATPVSAGAAHDDWLEPFNT